MVFLFKNIALRCGPGCFRGALAIAFVKIPYVPAPHWWHESGRPALSSAVCWIAGTVALSSAVCWIGGCIPEPGAAPGGSCKTFSPRPGAGTKQNQKTGSAFTQQTYKEWQTTTFEER